MDVLLLAIIGIIFLYIAWGIFYWRLALNRTNSPEWLALENEETELMYQELTAHSR
ncbi:MAG: hypothetical protein J0I20_31355 [Chloroflexi bacterium]|nr:hypothetical protein [Chloroflexota bacterium]